ncbi:MAG: hypothetical protein U5M23_04985 [Marinagarivorans sp.]|nr:hypothetical protein [Marinagarivorans sp.]
MLDKGIDEVLDKGIDELDKGIDELDKALDKLEPLSSTPPQPPTKTDVKIAAQLDRILAHIWIFIISFSVTKLSRQAWERTF